MALFGKGYFIWQVRKCENGDPEAIAAAAAAQGFTHLVLKIADGRNAYNLDPSTGADLLAPLVTALRRRGISPWGWHYVYGYDPIPEADIAVERLQTLGLDGYAIDAEAQYKEAGKAAAAVQFMNRLRARLGGFPIALCSYRYPTYHPAIPWQEFLDQCDLNMPQVYWVQADNPGAQLVRCVREFEAITPFRPIVPVGAAYTEGGWSPTPAHITEFLQTARSLNLSAANFWEWGNTRRYLPAIWEAVRAFNWGGPLPPPPPTATDPPPPTADIALRLVAALNTRRPEQVAALYAANAVHVTPTRTLRGRAAIQQWYATSFFPRLIPAGTFTLSGYSGTGASRYVSWAVANRAVSDTLGLTGTEIVYHYTKL
jgi:hypothetical protein